MFFFEYPSGPSDRTVIGALQPGAVRAQVSAWVGRWAELTGQWLSVHDLVRDRVVLVEGHEVLGWSRSSLADLAFMRRQVHADDHDALIRCNRAFREILSDPVRAREHAITLTLAHRLRRADGGFARVQRHVTPLIRSANGGLVAMLHLCRDITALAPESTAVRWDLQAPADLRAAFNVLMQEGRPEPWRPTPCGSARSSATSPGVPPAARSQRPSPSACSP
ncbi:MAG TPA: hypothetical protein PKE21_16890 [Flavobacteriales bacterium]|nr:hypothetical protein [Flavobacteriales bacterium]HMR29156.1 hypothetical protein [Flavobacteriales bacterium]